jgi:hypothetical protein
MGTEQGLLPYCPRFHQPLKVVALLRNISMVSQNLDACFRGGAARWWNIEVDSLLREVLALPLTSTWCRVLEECFKILPSQALSQLENTRHALMGAASCRSVTAFCSLCCQVMWRDLYSVPVKTWTYCTPSHHSLHRKPALPSREELDMHHFEQATQLVWYRYSNGSQEDRR